MTTAYFLLNYDTQFISHFYFCKHVNFVRNALESKLPSFEKKTQRYNINKYSTAIISYLMRIIKKSVVSIMYKTKCNKCVGHRRTQKWTDTQKGGDKNKESNVYHSKEPERTKPGATDPRNDQVI